MKNFTTALHAAMKTTPINSASTARPAVLTWTNLKQKLGWNCRCPTTRQGKNDGMAKKLTVKQMDARYEALREASEHLRMDWSDKAVECAEGLVMADWLKQEALKWLDKANLARVAPGL